MPRTPRTTRTARTARISPVSVEREIVCLGEDSKYRADDVDGYCFRSGDKQGLEVSQSEFQRICNIANAKNPGYNITVSQLQTLLSTRFTPRDLPEHLGFLFEAVADIEAVTPMFAVKKIGKRRPRQPAKLGRYREKDNENVWLGTWAWFFFFKEDAEKYINGE